MGGTIVPQKYQNLYMLMKEISIEVKSIIKTSSLYARMYLTGMKRKSSAEVIEDKQVKEEHVCKERLTP